ncbi:MAG TPA: multiheme c-type cytochrome [Acidobacteriota bacterium]|nr:multiheme c-type cytochrome [Acidobacteriota bacterium]
MISKRNSNGPIELILAVPLLVLLASLLCPSPGGRVLAVSSGPAAQALQKAAKSDLPVINPDGYTSARVCGQCHMDIYDSWKKSLHAFSLVDPVFDTAFMQAVKESGEEARRRCLNCHAPLTMMNGDYQLVQGVTREGVSCDFCHTVTQVHLDGREEPYSVDLGPVKRGVIKKAASPAHKVAFSELHGRSEFCGGCHNYLAPSGAPIMGTYSEWRKGPYAAQGVQCQNCHMALSTGKVVFDQPREKGSQIHLHSLIHDSTQLRGALEVRIVGAERKEEWLEVQVEVNNVGSGHMVPTGMPSREVVLEVEAESAGLSRIQRRSYRKVVADESNRPLKDDYEIILRGRKILSDNRLAPRQPRLERFRFPVWNSKPVELTATLSYHYSPMLVKKEVMNVELGRARRLVRGR